MQCAKGYHHGVVETEIVLDLGKAVEAQVGAGGQPQLNVQFEMVNVLLG